MGKIDEIERLRRENLEAGATINEIALALGSASSDKGTMLLVIERLRARAARAAEGCSEGSAMNLLRKLVETLDLSSPFDVTVNEVLLLRARRLMDELRTLRLRRR
jgi:hypothetical protein